MRRMITETDVEKLDSIKPSEIQKLGKITDADIESVKAMQSPIGATTDYVLTADGKGKATYKQSQSGLKMQYSSGGGGGEIAKSWFTNSPGYNPDRSKFPGWKIAETTVDAAVILCFNSLPYYEKTDGTKVYIAPGDYFIMRGRYGSMIFGLKDAVYDKLIEDTADQQFTFVQTGKFAQYTLKN